jgi:hypothetical protein
MKFVISNAKLYDLIQKQVKNYYYYLPKIICNVPQCMLLPRRLWDAFRNWKPNENTEPRFEDNTDTIKPQTVDNCWQINSENNCKVLQWLSAEKSNIRPHHSFIAQQQSCFYNQMKLKLKTGETAVICNFSENYSIILIQDEVQGFHWNSVQATLHPFVGYSRNCNDEAHQFYCFIRQFKTQHHMCICFKANYTAFFLVNWKIWLRFTIFPMPDCENTR